MRLQCQRIFHGRGKSFPGLEHICIDWLPPVILIILYKMENKQAIAELSQNLAAIFPECTSIQVQHRYQSHAPIELVSGKNIADLIVKEAELKFQIILGHSRNYGLFLDMRNGREWVRQNSLNKRVLNLFAYRCGFSVAAIEGQATHIINVDMSSAALSQGRDNHRLNQHPINHVRFEKLNIFNSFGRLKKKGPFDLLICDPPTFQKGSVDIKKDYPKIMRRLNEFMADNSTLLLCLNAPELGAEFLLSHMAELAPDYQFISEIQPPAIFRDAQNKGLTTLCFQRGSG